MVKIEKDLFVRDEYKVRRRVFVAGMVVSDAEYAQYFPLAEVAQLVMENKMLPEEPVEEIPVTPAPEVEEPTTEVVVESPEVVTEKEIEPKVVKPKAKK